MKFLKYINEIKYFKKIKPGYPYEDQPGVTIFVNPSPEEITEKEYNFIIDLQEKKLYIWPYKSAVFHDMVGKEIIKDWDEDDFKRFIKADTETSNNKLIYVPAGYERRLLAKEEWLKKYFTFKVSEEYQCMSGKFEIHKNPSFREMAGIAKNVTYQDKSNRQLRFIFDLSTGDFYAASSDCLHYRMIKEIGLNEDKIIRGQGILETGKVVITNIYDNHLHNLDKNDEVMNIFKDHGIKAKWAKYFDEMNEEYLTRFNNFEIFKNSSIKEMRKINQNGVRLLINMKTRNYYVFDFSLLHDKAYHIIKAGKNTEEFDGESIVRAEGDFSSGKLYIIWFKPWIWTKKVKQSDVAAIFKEHGVSTIFNEKGTAPKYSFSEEYVTSGNKGELHKNPSFREISSIAKQSTRFKKSVRVLIDIEKKVYYVAPIDYLHDDMVDDLDLNDETWHILRAIVAIENGKLFFKYLYDDDGIENWEHDDEITSIFKDHGIKVDYTRRSYN